jgi:transposase
MKGYRNLVSITGIGSRSAGVLLSIIGEVKDFASADKLAAYFGIVPRGIEFERDDKNRTAHQTRK